MKYALIGCGRISGSHMKAAVENGLEIVGVCDIEKEKTQNLLKDFELNEKVNSYSDYNEMIRKEKPDIVAIATESGSHARIALDCIENGQNVIIEKPIALSIEDADKIIEAAKRKSVKVSANHQNRFNKCVQRLYHSVSNNEFGKLFHGTVNIRWMRNEEYYKSDEWRGTWSHDGGTLMNQCIHGIDLLRWIMGGEITQVFAMVDNLNHSYIEAEDLGLALIRFKNGSYGVVEGTSNVYKTNYEHTLAIFGEKGFAKLGGKSVNSIDEWLVEGEEKSLEDTKKEVAEDPKNVYGFGHGYLYADMIDAIKNDRKPFVDEYAGKSALEIVLAIYKSAATGMPVALPLEKCSTMDFVGMFE